MVTHFYDNHFFDGFRHDGIVEWQKDFVVVPAWMNAARNAARGAESYARVEKLINEIRQVEIAVDKAHKENWFAILENNKRKPKVINDQYQELLRREEWIGKTLSRYLYSPGLINDWSDNRWTLSMSSVGTPKGFTLKRESPREGNRTSTKEFDVHYWLSTGEADVVLRVLNLASASELERLKQCDFCSKWLYAERSHQRFCPGAECRNAKYSKSNKHKEYRKQYMRRLRAKEAAERKAKASE